MRARGGGPHGDGEGAAEGRRGDDERNREVLHRSDALQERRVRDGDGGGGGDDAAQRRGGEQAREAEDGDVDERRQQQGAVGGDLAAAQSTQGRCCAWYGTAVVGVPCVVDTALKGDGMSRRDSPS